MTPAQAIRIFAILAVIFAAGIVTGRMTAPRPEVIVLGPSGTPQNLETALARLQRHLDLTEEEEEKFRALFEEMQPHILEHKPLTEKRIEVFRQYVPRMKELLPPQKHKALDRYIRDTERRFRIYSARLNEKRESAP